MKTTLGFLLSLALTLLEPLGPQIALEEVGSAVLPSGFRPVGIATGQEDIFVWGAAEGSFVAVHEGWNVTEHRLEAGRIRAAAWDGQYWQIMTALGEALTLSTSSCLTELALLSRRAWIRLSVRQTVYGCAAPGT